MCGITYAFQFGAQPHKKDIEASNDLPADHWKASMPKMLQNATRFEDSFMRFRLVKSRSANYFLQSLLMKPICIVAMDLLKRSVRNRCLYINHDRKQTFDRFD